MPLIQSNRTGKEYLNTATDLLQRIRLEGPYVGLFEAADVQWWWREEDEATVAERQLFWQDEAGRVVACLVRFDAGDEWSNDFFYLPSAQAEVESVVIPQVIAAITALGKPSDLKMREDDFALQQAAEAAGFARQAGEMIQTELVHLSPQNALPAGFTLTSRREDSRPHHLLARNDPNITTKLGECSLYRPELDLCIRAADGTAAAYALFWMDNVTKVGLIEPVRTERAFQRLGLARHVIGEGIARLLALGATSIRVTYSNRNEAATNLYHGLGFVDRIREVTYRIEE